MRVALGPNYSSVTSVEFFVAGSAQTAGSKTIVPTGAGPRVVDGGTTAARASRKTWRGDVRDAAIEALDGAGLFEIRAAISVRFVFVRRRPGFHLSTKGTLKPRFLEARPTTRPDALKLARAAEDALTGILWHDDSQIVEEYISKLYGDQVGLDPQTEGLFVKAALA